jgi:hypothetical protein
MRDRPRQDEKRPIQLVALAIEESSLHEAYLGLSWVYCRVSDERSFRRSNDGRRERLRLLNTNRMRASILVALCLAGQNATGRTRDT